MVGAAIAIDIIPSRLHGVACSLTEAVTVLVAVVPRGATFRNVALVK